MTDLNTLSDAELEAQVTDQAVIDASGGKVADPTAKETDDKKVVVDDKKDLDPKNPDPKVIDDKKGDEGDKTEKKETPSAIKTLLEKRNAERTLKEEALKTVADKEKIIEDQKKIIDELKNPKDGDKLSDEERAEKIQEAMTKKAIAEDKKEEALEKSKGIENVDEGARLAEIGEFLNANPELLSNKQEIMDLAKSYPNLPMDQVQKLRFANTNPSKLMTEQDINKFRGGFNMAGNFDRAGNATSDPTKMTDAELESNLQGVFAGGVNPLG